MLIFDPVILFLHFRKGVLLDMSNLILETISSEFASAAEKVGGSVVAVHARRWMPTSGIEWKKGVVVTVHHGVQRDEDIKVLLDGDRTVPAKLTGRDPSTDIAVLRIEEGSSGAFQFGDSTSLRLGHLVLALGRTRRGDLVASSGIIGGISGEWRNRRGGHLDQHIRLDLALYPGLSGGPLVNARGDVMGINTRGLAHGRAVTVPAATVNRVVEELLEKGHIARPYLGIAMQPVEVPKNIARSCQRKREPDCSSCTSKTAGPQTRPECYWETFFSNSAERRSNAWMRSRIRSPLQRSVMFCRSR